MTEELKPIRKTYISFLECEVRGFWIDDLDPEIVDEYPAKFPWKTYSALKEAEVSMVRSDGLRRIFKFEKGSEISIGQMMLEFNQEDVIDELSVDEDKQAGRG